MRILSLLLGAALLSSASAASDAPYQAITQIPIGGEGGWDILSVDSAAHCLYLSHATKVVVIDLEKNAVAGEIENLPGVHQLLPVPELQRGFTSNGKENKCSVIDLKTLKPIAQFATGENPDAMAYDDQRGEVYVFNHSGNSATVIDAKDPKVVATVALEGSPEFAAYDASTGRVYVNLEDKSEVAVIDTATHAVVARWPLAPGEEPTGIAFDATNHRLFSTCHNQMMTMLDTASGKVVATVPIARGVDGCAFDQEMQLAFASCGEGVVTIAQETSPNELKVVQSLATQRSARTIALDPATHRIYLPAAEYQPATSPAPGATPGRPAMVPGSMKLLVYGPHQS